MKRHFLLIVLLISMNEWLLATASIPDIWYRPDSLIAMPTEDSIEWTNEYTTFTVLRSLESDSIECLWSFTANDTISYAVLTNGVYTPNGIIHTRATRDFSKWCIYSYHSGIHLDSTKSHSFRLGEQLVYYQDSTGISEDTLRANVEMEEFAYYNGKASKKVSASFQTYLALKYGITLDYAAYLSSSYDTLWHPTNDNDYYNRIIGVGNDTIYGWQGYESRSKEDAMLHIRVDSLMPGEYILMGDDNASLEWYLNPDGTYMMPRIWRLRNFANRSNKFTLALQLSDLTNLADSLWLTVIDENGGEIQRLYADSIVNDSVCFFTPILMDSVMYFQLHGIVRTIKKTKQNIQDENNTGADIHYDAFSKNLIVDGYSDEQSFTLILYDAAGKYISTLSSPNPIDLSMLPNAIFYVEIIADNMIVGAISIPAKL